MAASMPSDSATCSFPAVVLTSVPYAELPLFIDTGFVVVVVVVEAPAPMPPPAPAEAAAAAATRGWMSPAPTSPRGKSPSIAEQGGEAKDARPDDGFFTEHSSMGPAMQKEEMKWGKATLSKSSVCMPTVVSHTISLILLYVCLRFFSSDHLQARTRATFPCVFPPIACEKRKNNGWCGTAVDASSSSSG